MVNHALSHSCSRTRRPQQHFSLQKHSVLYLTRVLTKKDAEGCCPRCNKLFATVTAMRRHMMYYDCKLGGQVGDHPTQLHYQCRICHKSYIMESAMKNHIRMHRENPHLNHHSSSTFLRSEADPRIGRPGTENWTQNPKWTSKWDPKVELVDPWEFLYKNQIFIRTENRIQVQSFCLEPTCIKVLNLGP